MNGPRRVSLIVRAKLADLHLQAGQVALGRRRARELLLYRSTRAEADPLLVEAFHQIGLTIRRPERVLDDLHGCERSHSRNALFALKRAFPRKGATLALCSPLSITAIGVAETRS